MLPTYDVNMCIVCQEKTEESLCQILSDARDNQLIDAFQVAPFTFAPLKVRFDQAVDASAGEIKYHKSCWTIIRVKRDFEGEVSQEIQNK